MDVRAYMVPKNELLEWCSQVLDLEVTRLEHCTSGAIYCQLLDAYYGNNAINLSKVNFLAKIDYEIVSNYKQLQLGLNKAGIEKYIDVERLAKGSQSDNLEFLQWLYHECRRKGRNPNYYYNARERRALCKGGDTKEIPLPFSMASNFIPASTTLFPHPCKRARIVVGQTLTVDVCR